LRTGCSREYLGLRRRNNETGEDGMHNEQLHNFYSSPKVIMVKKLRRTRLAGRVEHMEEKTKVSFEDLKEMVHLEVLVVDGGRY
jgi:hypothetical protein